MVAPVAASASEVSWTFSGVITGESGDVGNLVNVAGSVVGLSITGSVSYDTGVFGTPNTFGTSVVAAWDSTGGTLPNGTLTITETINGVTFGFSGAYYNGLLLAYGSPGSGDWPYSDWTQAYEVLSETSTPWGVDAAEINLGRPDETVALVDPSLSASAPPNLAAIQDQVAGTDWFTAAGPASWGFDITEAQEVPEPGALGLLGVGVAGLGAARRGRGDARG